MTIKQISVRVGNTITFGFSSIRNEVGMVADLDPGEDPDAAYEALYAKARQKLVLKTQDIAPSP